MVTVPIPNIPKLTQPIDILMEVPYIEISDVFLARQLGYYLKPLTKTGLIRFLPGTYDGKGSVVIRKSRSVTKKHGKGKSIKYVFSNERMKIPRF